MHDLRLALGKYIVPLVLGAVMAFGLLARIWGLGFGLPFEYQVDERPYLGPAWLLQRGQVDVLLSPQSLVVAALGGTVNVAAALARAVGVPASGPSETDFILLGRVTSAVAGTATAIPVYLLTRVWWTRPTSLLAALFISTFFLAVRNAHFGTPDTLGAFLVALAAYGTARIWRSPARIRTMLLLGVAIGMAVAARPATVLLLLPVVLYQLGVGRASDGDGRVAPSLAPTQIARRLVARPMVALIAAVGVGFFIGAPATLLKPLEYARMLQTQLALGKLGGFGRFQVIDGSGWAFYAWTLRWGIGDLVLALTIVGLIWIFVRGRRGPAILFVFPVLTLASMGATGHAFARYLLPLLPFIAIAAAVGTTAILQRIPLYGSFRVSLAVLLISLTIAPSLVSSVTLDQLFTRVDTRTVARSWIESNISPGSTIALEWYTPQLERGAADGAQYRTFPTSVFGLSERSVSEYRQLGADYLVTSSFASDTKMIIPAEDQSKRAFYAELDANADVVQQFNPFSNDQQEPYSFEDVYAPALSLFDRQTTGPIIKIYRLRPPAP